MRFRLTKPYRKTVASWGPLRHTSDTYVVDGDTGTRHLATLRVWTVLTIHQSHLGQLIHLTLPRASTARSLTQLLTVRRVSHRGELSLIYNLISILGCVRVCVV